MSARAPDWALRPIQLPVLTTLGTLIYFFGPVSGALLNPAVSLSFVVKGRNAAVEIHALQRVADVGAAAATMCHGIFPDALHMPLATTHMAREVAQQALGSVVVRQLVVSGAPPRGEWCSAIVVSGAFAIV